MSIPENYQIVRSLGLGATSEVFEAVNTDTSERIALKMFSPLILSDRDAVQRLQGEVEALEKLRHPNIVVLKRTVARPDFFALELELVEGCDLRSWSTAFDSALFEPRLWILAQVARGLGAAHENGVLHRDLKPENILVSRDGSVKLTDFGLSRSISRLTLTRMGLLVGSLGYMAPECVNGFRATERSDLFSFGVIAYELLAGRAPFEAETPQALIKKITDGDFPTLRSVCSFIPDTVASEIDRCLTIIPDLRPESSWSVEAVLMNSLMSSGLLQSCRRLVSTTSREAELPAALTAKHERLAGRVADLLEASAENPAEMRRRLMPAVNELKRIFPDDALIARSLVAMTSPPPIRPKRFARARRLWPVPLVLFPFLFALVPRGANHYSSVSDVSPLPVVQAPNLTPSASTTAKTLPNSIEKIYRTSEPKKSSAARGALASGTVKKKARLPKIETGELSFQADPDVDIYVDNKLISPTAWESYPTAPGPRQVRMVKAGFEPIENTVSVTVGQKTVVKAKR